VGVTGQVANYTEFEEKTKYFYSFCSKESRMKKFLLLA
jgi:hypothetical protein